MIEYRIVHSKRKSVGIYVLADGNVEVRCPRGTKKEYIDDFVRQKETWINETSARRAGEYAKKKSFELKIGDKLLLLGKEYPLEKSVDSKYGFDGTRFYVPGDFEGEQIKKCIVILYKSLARDILKKKVLYYSDVMNTAASAIRINSAKTRWGSCGGKNSLNFTWKLILAPEAAVDYVVVHELAHTKEHNHGRHFWEIVEGVMPDYKKRRAMLSDLQGKLASEEWD